jgi:hypothetical protein
MAGQIDCACGEVLVEEIDARGIRPVGGTEFIQFRRTTDYVMCEHCLRTYNMPALIEKAEGADTIEHLERLADQMHSAE